MEKLAAVAVMACLLSCGRGEGDNKPATPKTAPKAVRHRRTPRPATGVTRENVISLIRDGKLTRVQDPILGLLRPSIRLAAQPASGEPLRVGTSRIGGAPDLPAGVEWPKWKGKPQSFIAQLNLAELAALDEETALPSSGMLYFFYTSEQDTWGFDPADRGSWKVIHVNVEASRLKRAELPPGMPADGKFQETALRLSRDLCLPPQESADVDGLGLSEDESNRYHKINVRLQSMRGGEDDPVHRVLGHPEPVQGDMQEDCQLASNGIYRGDSSWSADPRAVQLQKGSRAWRLLLQIDSDEAVGTMWGDAGRIYYWIRQEDLAAGRFENTWLVLQCY